MTQMATALVQYGPEKLRVEEFELPTLGEGEVLLEVEANGLCASDIEAYRALDIAWDGRPRILGHEIVGTIVDMGPKSFNRQELELGDRVCLNAFVPCGLCGRCMVGDFGGCVGREERLRYGAVATEVAPSLWGGYATHAFVPKNGILYKVPPHIGAYDASLWQSIAGGFEWAVTQAGMKVGDRVLILGPGQRGIGALLAARQAGASQVVLTGLAKDQFKLDVALELGADAVINVESEDFLTVAKELGGSEGFDVILDTTPHATAPIIDAVRLLRRRGTIVVIGLKLQALDGFPIDELIYKNGTLRAWAGISDHSFRLALDYIVKNVDSLSRLRTHVFGFDQLDIAIDVLTGQVPGEHALNVVIDPKLTGVFPISQE